MAKKPLDHSTDLYMGAMTMLEMCDKTVPKEITDSIRRWVEKNPKQRPAQTMQYFQEFLVSASGERAGRADEGIRNLGQVFHQTFQVFKAMSLDKALDYLGLKFEGEMHTAVVDAKNLARLHMKMIDILRDASTAWMDKLPAPVEAPGYTGFLSQLDDYSR
jgi:DNA polymerase III epsilon subunit-like protein